MDIEELSQKIARYHEDDKREAKYYRYQNLSYILWGFALAVAGIAYAKSDWILYIISVFFLIGGFFTLWHSVKFREKKQ